MSQRSFIKCGFSKTLLKLTDMNKNLISECDDSSLEYVIKNETSIFGERLSIGASIS